MAQIGDIAPAVTFSTTVRSPENAPWSQDQLIGKLTVLEFYPKLSTSQLYRVHNRRVDRHRERNVQFVLIVGDDESTLQQWLEKYRIEIGGWLLLDPDWEAARAYGIRIPQTVFIDRTARVLGISRLGDDTDRQIDEIVEGRAESARLRAQSDLHGVLTPALPPSETVRIAPAESETGTTQATGRDYWAALGLPLKQLLATAWNRHESALNLTPDLDTATRYDVRLVLPSAESPKAIALRIQQALKEYFQLEATHEKHSVPVYEIAEQPEDLTSVDHDGGVGWAPIQAAGSPVFVHHTSAIGKGFQGRGSMIRFSRGWIVVRETDRPGYQGLDLYCLGPAEGFRQALRDELQITVQREESEVLVVRTRMPKVYSS